MPAIATTPFSSATCWRSPVLTLISGEGCSCIGASPYCGWPPLHIKKNQPRPTAHKIHAAAPSGSAADCQSGAGHQ